MTACKPCEPVPAHAEACLPRVVVCFSHLRWQSVFQRPHHLMTRFARSGPVIYWEEPVTVANSHGSWLETRRCRQSDVVIATPHLGEHIGDTRRQDILSDLLHDFVGRYSGSILKWYYTPMMLGFSRRLPGFCTVYDCMDELANFAFAPPGLAEMEQELMARADVMFTGGHSLFESKKGRHANIHAFPSSVDRDHFAKARHGLDDPADQLDAPHPRLGFFGVVDERIDLDLLSAVADARRDWSLMIVGPVAKIDPASLPRRPNIHYLGAKPYSALPSYMAGWDVALMPFAMNKATRFISPTKMPEYLAGGRPVVSTPVADVVRCYGHLEGVWIADDARGFVEACAAALDLDTQGPWLAAVDAEMANDSWDRTFARMQALIGRESPAPVSGGAAPAALRSAPRERVLRMRAVETSDLRRPRSRMNPALELNPQSLVQPPRLLPAEASGFRRPRTRPGPRRR